MIPRITRGGSGYGALSYDHGPGRRDEHRNAHKVGGNIAGKTWQQRSAAMDDHVRRMHPKLTKPITRTSLRLAPEDRNLTDREWRAVAERYVQEMGYADGPWEAVRHADDHIHLTMSRVQWDGGVVDQWKDKTRAQSAVRDIEREHGLIDASSRYNRDLPQLSRNDVERSQRATELTGRTVDPEKQQLRDRVSASELSSRGTRDGFERELTANGVAFRANVSGPTERNPHGKMNGYSYRLDGHTDANGDPVWFKASQLGQRYGWAQTERRLEQIRPDTTVQGGGDSDGVNRRAAEVEATTARAPHEHEGNTVVASEEKKSDRERKFDRDDEIGTDDVARSSARDDAEGEAVTHQPAARAAENKADERRLTDSDRDATTDRDSERGTEDGPSTQRPDTGRGELPRDREETPREADAHDNADRSQESTASTESVETRSTADRETTTARPDTNERETPAPVDEDRAHSDDRDQPEQDHEAQDSSSRSSEYSRDETPEQQPGQEPSRAPRAVDRNEDTNTAAPTRETREFSTDARDADRSPSNTSPRDERRTSAAAEAPHRDTALAGDSSPRPSSRDQSRDRAQKWAQERRERTERGRDRSIDQRGPEHENAGAHRPGVDHGTTPAEDRRPGGVGGPGEDDHQHRTGDTARTTSPDKSGHTEGERPVSKSQQRETQRDAKEQSRERAEKWSQDRKERTQDTERDRGPERDR